MDNGLKQIFESQVLNDETKRQIQEAWENKVNEVRDEVTSEIREEFAQKYDRDKANIVEAMDQKINESLQEQVDKLEQEQQKLVQERINYKKNSRKHAEKFLENASSVLESELKEFQEDRKQQMRKLGEFSKFIENGISEAVQECYDEQNKLAEDRVKFRKQASNKIQEAKKRTVKELASAADSFISETLQGELGQLKEELAEARQNDFGKKIFEAFMNEYSSSFHDENREFRKLKKAIVERENKLEEAKRELEAKEEMISESQRKVQLKENQLKRQKKLSELLSPLGKESREVMEDMLKDVSTPKLEETFNRYLPGLLEDSSHSRKSRRNLSESKERKNLQDVTGDKKDVMESFQQNENDEQVSQFLDAFNRMNQQN